MKVLWNGLKGQVLMHWLNEPLGWAAVGALQEVACCMVAMDHSNNLCGNLYI